MDPSVTLAVTQGKHPRRPAEILKDTRFGDERWAMLLRCWQLKAESRPKAIEVKDMVSSQFACNLASARSLRGSIFQRSIMDGNKVT
jgi:hypothetical protein